uniref:Uncharacterized protein n=1 Tax=Romanomermis culicivorax TaxID=13658 RepID=A0A915KJL7_ROMCU
MTDFTKGCNAKEILANLKSDKQAVLMKKQEELVRALENIRETLTPDQFLDQVGFFAPKSGIPLPEWKRQQIAVKKCAEAIKQEEIKLLAQFDEWKSSQKPQWARMDRKIC